MNKLQISILLLANVVTIPAIRAEYAQGCADPSYQQYVDERLSQFEARNRRLLERTYRDYEISLATSSNPYLVIADLSRHVKYSAQFEPIEEVITKIDRIFEHSNQLTLAQQIAGDVLDGFSSETHAVGVARAWLAYRQGRPENAFVELMKSIDVKGSAVLSSFGPDFDFVRQIYADGHTQTVIDYIKKTETFWAGSRPDELRTVWLKMIEKDCKILFDSFDTIKARDLGIN